MAPACLGIITHGKRKGGASGIMERRYCNGSGLELSKIKLLVLRAYCRLVRRLRTTGPFGRHTGERKGPRETFVREQLLEESGAIKM